MLMMRSHVFEMHLYNVDWYNWQLFVTKNNDHSQPQDYCPHDIHDKNDIMMQPNYQNTDQLDY